MRSAVPAKKQLAAPRAAPLIIVPSKLERKADGKLARSGRAIHTGDETDRFGRRARCGETKGCPAAPLNAPGVAVEEIVEFGAERQFIAAVGTHREVFQKASILVGDSRTTQRSDRRGAGAQLPVRRRTSNPGGKVKIRGRRRIRTRGSHILAGMKDGTNVPGQIKVRKNVSPGGIIWILRAHLKRLSRGVEDKPGHCPSAHDPVDESSFVGKPTAPVAQGQLVADKALHHMSLIVVRQRVRRLADV